MKERPIIFSAPMVRAILEGRKSQTRRIVKPQPEIVRNEGKHTKYSWRGGFYALDMYPSNSMILHHCRHGKPGDRLWVKETFGVVESAPYADGQSREEIIYRADGWKDDGGYFKWKPSIFMPRDASRILLEITQVRVERLRDISEGDAKAEGVDKEFRTVIPFNGKPEGCKESYSMPLSYRAGYANLWGEINRGPGQGWDVNPFVWVIEFKRTEQTNNLPPRPGSGK